MTTYAPTAAMEGLMMRTPLLVRVPLSMGSFSMELAR